VVNTFTSDGSVFTVTQTQTQPVVVEVTTLPSSDQANASSGSSSNSGLIGGVVGGVVGGLALLTALVVLGILLKRRKERTGHAWFLCFGRRPRGASEDGDWPTFDPNSPGLATTAASARGGGAQGGTLPAGFDDDPEAGAYGASSSGHYGEMREYGAAGAGATAAGYYGARSRQESHGGFSADGYPLSNATGPSMGGPSEEGHFSLPSQHAPHMSQSSAGAAWPMGGMAFAPPVPQPAPEAPTYDHLDPVDVQQARMREQHAAGAAPPYTHAA
jgi:hypothetical protein